MFFIMGAGQDQKVLPFDQIMLCKCCGKFGHIQIIMTYSYFSFFFIPLFKWNRHYYAKMNCCGAVCELSPELGKEIARGNVTSVNENDLIFSPGLHPADTARTAVIIPMKILTSAPNAEAACIHKKFGL